MKSIVKIAAAAVSAAMAFSVAAGVYAENDALYCCVYYGSNNELMYVKNIRGSVTDEDVVQYVNHYCPDGADRAVVYKWNENMNSQQPAEQVTLAAEIDKLESTVKAPNVTTDLCRAEFWIDNKKASDELILTYGEIERLNKKIMEADGTNMIDLSELPEKYNGRAMADAAAAFESPQNHYLNGEPVEESYYQAIRDNIKNAKVSKDMDLKYGVCVNRTVMKGYPYSDYISDTQADIEWDDFVSTAVSVNEPLAVYYTTADGEFTLVKSKLCSGWVPTEDIAVCKDKDEWTEATSFENKLVVTGEKVYLEDSADKDLAQKMLTMGTVLELDEEYREGIASRLPWNNYVVKLPARAEDGSFYQKYAMIPSNRDVNIGYLPYTSENVVKQAFKSLGNRYGWGGMLNSQDCSSFMLEVYKCFGINIPRNTTWQAKMPVVTTSLEGMTDEEKMNILDTLPAGTILQFKGHEMMYLGEHNGFYYTINDVSSIADPYNTSVIVRPRSVIVNDLTTKRGNGTTWLSNLNLAIEVR